MTDNYTIALQNTLEAVWGGEGYKTWVETENPAIPPLSPQQTTLLLAAMELLNWQRSHLNAFLKEKVAIAQIEELPASQIDQMFTALHEATADWLEYRIPGGQGASLGALSSAYWQARLAEYPQPAAPWVRTKRKGKWLLDGYIPPDRAPEPDSAPEPDRDRDPDPAPPDFGDWERYQYPDIKEWYLPLSA